MASILLCLPKKKETKEGRKRTVKKATTAGSSASRKKSSRTEPHFLPSIKPEHVTGVAQQSRALQPPSAPPPKGSRGRVLGKKDVMSRVYPEFELREHKHGFGVICRDEAWSLGTRKRDAKAEAFSVHLIRTRGERASRTSVPLIRMDIFYDREVGQASVVGGA